MASDSGPHLLICVWKCCYKVHMLNFLRVYEMWAPFFLYNEMHLPLGEADTVVKWRNWSLVNEVNENLDSPASGDLKI